MLAEVVGGVRVSRAAHFFDDLGADSMAMARFCARVRKRTDLPSGSVKEVYKHPTVRDLATALTREATLVAPVPPEPAPVPVRAGWGLASVGTPRYERCGTCSS